MNNILQYYDVISSYDTYIDSLDEPWISHTHVNMLIYGPVFHSVIFVITKYFDSDSYLYDDRLLYYYYYS